MNYNWFLFKRFLQIILILCIMSFLVFYFIRQAAGDPALMSLSAGGTTPSEKLLEVTREEYGLNRPLFIQYKDWVIQIIHGNLGVSFSSGRLVTLLLAENLKNTVVLAFSSLLFIVSSSIFLGVISVKYYNTWIDYFIQFLSFVNISTPNFWFALLLLFYFGLRLKWFPIISTGYSFKDIFLPTVTIAASQIGQYTRQIRSSLLEELEKDYILMAHAQGISESTLWLKHLLPNALLPLLPLLGQTIGWLLGGVAAVEIIFSWPGLGRLAVTAIEQRNYPVVQGYILMICLFFLVINLFIDIFYYLVDPRMRNKGV